MKFKCPKPESEHEFRPQCAGTSAEEPKTKQKHKKIRRQNVIYNGVTVALVTVICFCMYQVIGKEVKDAYAEELYKGIRGSAGLTEDPPGSTNNHSWSAFPTSSAGSPLELVPEGQKPLIFPQGTISSDGYKNRQEELWDIYENRNKDIIAWIYIPGTNISYPVCQSDSEYYLKHSIDRTPTDAGTLFISDLSSFNPVGRNVVIHGHNMRNGTMFGKLNQFHDEKDWLKNHQCIYIDTLYGTYRYEIFSSYITDKYDEDYRSHVFSDSGFVQFCNRILDKGIQKVNTTFTAYDRILTLSTCNSDAGTDKRTIVHAKLVWPDPNAGITTTPELSPTVTPGSTSSTTPGITPEITEKPTSPHPVNEIRYVNLNDTTSQMNMRQRPSRDSQIVTKLNHGTKLTVLAHEGDWLHVQTEFGDIGYVLASYTVTQEDFDPDRVTTPAPSEKPTKRPEEPTDKPSETPSGTTEAPTDEPTELPTEQPTEQPSPSEQETPAVTTPPEETKTKLPEESE